MVTFLKVLADKSRLRILGLLTEREYTVKELAATMDLKEPTISHHLNGLRNLGIVEMRPEGTAHYYSLRQEGIHRLLRELKASQTPPPEEFEGDAFERSVLQKYFVAGRLREIPTQQKKLLVVLRHLAPTFTPGERYTEKQVSEILKAYHPDFASLRRYLVDWKFLARENSIYWRSELSAEASSEQARKDG